MIRNPYFNNEAILETKAEGKRVEEQKIEAKAYPREGIPHETVKGLTSIIIPAFFNSYPVFHSTGNCIGSVREHTDEKKTPYEIILVINGNTGIGWLDREKETWNNDNVKQAHVDKIITNQENLGYAKAVNQGIRVASGEYLVFLNNDVQVFDHWLEDFHESLNHVQMIQAYPMYGMPWGRAVEAEELRNKEIIASSIEESLDDFRDFSCVGVRKETLSEVGLFNEEFEMYCEDLDLIRRIEKAGGVVKSTRRVRTHHVISLTASSIPETSEIMNRSKEKLHQIWGY